MFKLLTEKDRSKLQREYALRQITTITTGLCLVFTIGIVSLFPSYLLSSARESEALERFRIMEYVRGGNEGEDARLWLMSTNRKLALLSPKFDEDRPSVVIDNLLKDRDESIKVTVFVWKKSGDIKELLVSGVARDRQALIRFESDINESGHFSNVTIPVSNLARDKDIEFSLKLLPVPRP